MIGSNERIYWKGSPNMFAAAVSPHMVVSYVFMAILAHEKVTDFFSYMLRVFGISYSDSVLYAYVPVAFVALMAIWSYIFSVTTVYLLTGERLVIRKGIFLRVEDEIELYRVIDITHSIHLLQRLIGIGTVVIRSNDKTGTVTMKSINNPGKIRNGLRMLAERCKSRRGVRILE
jgi:Bacterial membrane flanked domain.